MFSRKGTKICHPLLLFTNNPVQESPSKNILILDSKLNFEEHLRTVSIKANQTIGLLRKLQKTLQRQSLLTTYKSFIRPHLDCGDVMPDQSYKLLSIESYNFPIQRCISYNRSQILYKIIANLSPSYLINLILKITTALSTRSSKNISLLSVKHNFFLSTFYPSVNKEWNLLGTNIRSSRSMTIFKKCLLNFKTVT